MRCNCESAHCHQHGGTLNGPEGYPETDPCPNEADGHFTMDYVGVVCKTCAGVSRETGGAVFIHEVLA